MPIELISMWDSFKLFTIKAIRGNGLFSDAFAKLRKATVSFVMSVCPPVLQFSSYNWAVTVLIFMKFDI